MRRPLSRRFYARRCDVVARALLGKILVANGRAGRIVETEAYLGPEDAASHARFGSRARNRIMFGPPGHAYVYFIYGMYDMFNVVAAPDGTPNAVLVRTLEPVDDDVDADLRAAAGPGKLTRALGITRDDNGADLTAARGVYIADGRRRGEVAVGPRIGIDYAGEWAKAPLRFWLPDSPAVSRTR